MIELEWIKGINNRFKKQYKFVISTTLNALFTHEFYTTKELHSCKSLHEFLLSDHNQNNEKQLKQHAAAKLKDVDITNFARSIRNLKTRYNNDHKKNKNLTVERFILQNKKWQ